jgi:hypothetical protein
VARAHRAVEPLHSQMYFAPEHDETFSSLGLRPGRMSYFAGRAAPMGAVGAGVVTATFYNFSPSLVAHMIPRAWTLASPEQVVEARWDVARRSLTRLLGQEAIDSAEFAELAGLLREACSVLTPEGRPLYAGHADLPWPEEPLLELWHAATLLREHRGDGHIAALMAEGIGGLEAHVLLALDLGIPAPTFGRIHHLPSALLSDLIDGMKGRGLIEDEETFTPDGRQVKDRVETTTDDLAAVPYEVLDPAERDELIAALEPLAQKLVAAQDWG